MYLDKDLKRLELDFKKVKAQLVNKVINLNKDKKLVLTS
jgi:hypothetical protein